MTTESRGASPAPTAPNEPEYVWQSKIDHSRRRLQIREEALENALKTTGPLARALESAIKEIEHQDNKTTSTVVGIEALRKWIDEADAIHQDHQAFEVLVGVQGATGAGKTSLLNAILGFRELLPTNSSEAATATACRIEYNHENDPEKTFRAEVAFRSRKDVKAELDRFFKDLAFRRDLREGKLSDEYDHNNEDSGERTGAIRAATENIQETLDKIKAVWPEFSIADLESLKTTDLLKATHPGVKFLNRTFHLADGHIEAFSKNVKSFLDSTNMGVGTGAAGSIVSLWPLISYVKVFVKSPILRHGVVLVDLPGLSDAVESRAAVARSFYSKLAVTAVVTPAGRAADEKTGRNLMDENQELQLRMNDKCDGRYFCVLLSKTDEIDWEKFPAQENLEAQSENIQKIKHLRRDIKTLGAKIAELLKQWKDFEKTRKKSARASKSKNNDANTDTSKAETKQTRRILKRAKRAKMEKVQKLHEAKELAGATIHSCLQARRRKLRDRIVGQLQEKQVAFGLEIPEEAKNKPIQVIPVSTKAFWAVEDASSVTNPLDGFPSIAYTGVPEFRQWIDEATSQRRERHAIILLNRLNGLLVNIKTWLSNEYRNNRVKPSGVKITEKRINPVLRKMRIELGTYGKRLEKRIQNCDPLRSREKKTDAVNLCISTCRERVRLWRYKNPDVPEEPLHYVTHGAIIKRYGTFVSKVTGSHDWMGDQSRQYINQIAHSWIVALHREIPSLVVPARDEIDRICRSYSQALASNLECDFPNRKRYLFGEIAALDAVKEEIKDKVDDAIIQISTQSNEIHPQLKDKVKEEWKPAFNKAMKLKGAGSMRKRQEALEEHVEKKGKDMYNSSVNALQKELKESQMKFQPMLDQIWDQANELFSRRMDLIIGNLIKYDGGEVKDVELAENSKAELQEQVRGFISDWLLAWNTLDATVEDLDTDKNKIPHRYVHVTRVDDDEDEDDDDGDLDNCVTDDSEDDNTDSEDKKMPDIQAGPPN